MNRKYLRMEYGEAIMKCLFIKHVHLNTILKRAREENIEICGFLVGREEGEKVFVDYIVFEKNILSSSHEFEIDPLETLKVLESAEKKNKDIVGIFHSHVSFPPYPSQKDLKRMKAWRNVWLIVNNLGQYAAFILKDGEVKRIEVKVE
ncbi:MAG TPA: M67 family peptidase [Thermococcus sp.]|uniref:M67 family metallopeptidase n=1 Tax=Thermococcus sp. TaxID=35749 RepID=UPI000F1A3DA6|nr:M67 family metallopeptidase [Thermococcus sp.]MCD6143106.1 M67 family metallopeptidase [Thermococcus sp.]RLF78043.1 MAG: metalloprotease [Thermococci archaeon]HDH43870.1 M67 family peptidase [Thermococcus sp.]